MPVVKKTPMPLNGLNSSSLSGTRIHAAKTKNKMASVHFKVCGAKKLEIQAPAQDAKAWFNMVATKTPHRITHGLLKRAVRMRAKSWVLSPISPVKTRRKEFVKMSNLSAFEV